MKDLGAVELKVERTIASEFQEPIDWVLHLSPQLLESCKNLPPKTTHIYEMSNLLMVSKA